MRVIDWQSYTPKLNPIENIWEESKLNLKEAFNKLGELQLEIKFRTKFLIKIYWIWK